MTRTTSSLTMGTLVPASLAQASREPALKGRCHILPHEAFFVLFERSSSTRLKGDLERRTHGPGEFWGPRVWSGAMEG